MKERLTQFLLLLVLCFTFAACKKASVEDNTPPSFLTTAESKAGFAKSIKNYYAQLASARGENNSERSRFIAPFVSTEGWGLLEYDPASEALRLGFFTAELDKNDFYRENRDGTVSLHVNSNNAFVEYYANLFDEANPYYWGTNAHFDANYTGPVVDLEIEGKLIKIIDISSPGKAVSIHGNGRLNEISGSSSRISVNIVVTPSGNVSTELKVN